MATKLAGNMPWALALMCALGACATEIQEGVTNALRPSEEGGSATAGNGGSGGVGGTLEKAGAAGSELGTAGGGVAGALGSGGSEGGTAGSNAGSAGAMGGVAGLPSGGQGGVAGGTSGGGIGGGGGEAGGAGKGGNGGSGGNGGAGGAPAKACTASKLALKAAAASSNQDDTFPVTNAIDGDEGTRWSSASSDPQWIYVDLGEPAHVSRVVLHWETAYALSYRIELAAAANGPWKSVYERLTGDGDLDDLSQILAGVGRYVRVYSTKRATQYGISLYELEVYGDLDETCK